ncbi:MAG: hypothetical protein LLG93_05265 [Deltaproteobacteria bacterium]|nr:hypothetical protein [Deltaproteobacteria bacterium]
MKNLTIVSDDLTGAVDSSSFSMASGSRVRVEIAHENHILPHNGREVISINMSSRTLKGEESRKRHQELAAKIRELPDQLVMKKMDTGFRGNATFEMEGIMKGLGMEVCFVLDHSPSRNTFTLYGNQYVEGVILPKSVFGTEDPLKRQRSAYIPDILAKDATLPVGLVDIDKVKGNRLLEDVRDATGKGLQVLVFDVTGDADCSKIIRTLSPHYANALWAGSNGLGWGLADYLYGRPKEVIYTPGKDLRCACFTASAYSVVRRQIAAAQRRGLSEVILDMDNVVSGDRSALAEAIRNCLKASESGSFILSPRLSPGMGGEKVSDLILASIAQCAEKICASIHFDRIVVVGGETSYAILHGLGITKLYLSEKPETGVGTGTIGDGPYAGKSFSIKGGSIGSDAAICRMLGMEEE